MQRNHIKPIAMIPARGGSERIPRKNIAPILGKPALGMLIEKLDEFGMFDKIIVSTDDGEISRVAESFGAKVIGRSHGLLSNNLTSSEEAIRDAIKILNLERSEIPIFCIYPLAILIKKRYLIDAMALLELNPEKFVIAGGIVSPNPTRHTFIQGDETIRVLFPENNLKRSQDLDIVYADSGMFYLANPNIWTQVDKYWYYNNATAVVIEKEDSLDVDTLEDLDKLREIVQNNLIHDQDFE